MFAKYIQARRHSCPQFVALLAPIAVLTLALSACRPKTQLPLDNPAAQLKHAEKWYADHKESPELMLRLAQISLNNELWGKARQYLEACIECGGTVEAYRELGHLLEQLDEKEQALDLYRRGIEQATPREVTPVAAAPAPDEAQAESGDLTGSETR